MRSTIILLLVLAELACIGFGGWVVFAKDNFLLGSGFVVASYFLSIVLQRMIRYELKIKAFKKAIKKGDLRTAEGILLEAMELAAKFKSTDPRIAELWNASGSLYLDNAQYTEAERCFRRAIAVREQLFGPDHFLVGECLYFVGRVQMCVGQLGDAERTLLRAQELVRSHPRPGYFCIAMVLSSLSSLRMVQGKAEEAERLAVEARD